MVTKLNMFVYCLATVEEPIQTYVGATVNLDKRLQQHNGLLSGGAKATSKRPGQWYRVCHVSGFDTWNQTLSFEWHWKHYARRLIGTPLERRMNGLDRTLEWCVNKNLVVHHE